MDSKRSDELGLKKYKINLGENGKESTIDAIRKRINKILNEEGIESIDEGKSTPMAKRSARTYSSEIKDRLLSMSNKLENIMERLSMRH